MSIGFIGLGQIGAPMAARLAPLGVIVHDVRAEAVSPLVERGAIQAGSVAEVVERSGVVSIMVRDDDQVRAVVDEAATVAHAGTVLAIHSTIRVGTAEELAERGIALVDAPVSGGMMGAAEAALAVMVGGEPAVVDRCREPFSHWASLFVHTGPVGSGTKAKLARNLMHFVAFTAAGEAQRLAEAAGLSVADLGKVVRHSDKVTGGPGAIMIRDTTAALDDDDPLREIFEHTAALGEKDLSFALELGRALGVDLPLGEIALERFATSLGVRR